MRMRLLSLACLSVVVAGCGTSTLQGAGGQAGSAATSSTGATGSSSATAAPTAPASATASSSAASTAAPGAAAGTSPASGRCAGPVQSSVSGNPGGLSGVQFISATQGWAVGPGRILATTDGGAHWQVQLSGRFTLGSVDFISAEDGWAVGPDTLLATTDGGGHWTALPEPCPVIDSAHFISPTTGFAVAGGQNIGATISPEPPDQGGMVLTTSDGGHTWHQLAAPASAQTVCFSDPEHGWLGAAGLLYRTSNGGQQWTALTSMAGQAGSSGSSYTAGMVVECANNGAAWAERVGPGAAMSQEPHVGYYADQSGASPIFAEQYFQNAGGKPVAQSPGSVAGAFSSLSSSAAVFIDNCTACGTGTAPWDLATNSGATLTKEGNVGDITEAGAASFQSPEDGWVTGAYQAYSSATGRTQTQSRIVATTDGGRTWHVQWASPWTYSN